MWTTYETEKWTYLPWRGDWGDRPPKTYESKSFHHDFVQFGKQHSRYQAILPSIVLSQKYCEVYLSLSYSSELVMRLDCQILLKSPPPPYWLDPSLVSGDVMMRSWGVAKEPTIGEQGLSCPWLFAVILCRAVFIWFSEEGNINLETPAQ